MLEEDFRLRVFVTVAELGGFSAAARQLGVSQSAVSQNIAELERQTGAALFERTRNSLSITPTGGKLVFKKFTSRYLQRRIRGIHDLYFKFTGADKDMFTFDWWRCK